MSADLVGLTDPSELVRPDPSAGSEPDGATDRQRAIGVRLRRIRHQQGLSLAEVEQRSGGVWKAVVVGAYERGDRAVTVTRLARLAEFYGVPLSDLLAARRATTDPGGRPDRFVLDLTRLGADGDPGVSAVMRFAERIQQLRGDHNGRVLTLRGADVEAIAVAVGELPDVLVDDLRERGVLRP